MVERLSPQDRSALMRRVGAKNTAPEMAVRRTVHGLGYRYRVHVKELPGSPDLVFRSRKKVIFVHGCFWHRHEKCSRASTPTTNVEFWNAKFQRNIVRDQRNELLLKSAGWDVLTIWECQARDLGTLAHTIRRFLE